MQMKYGTYTFNANDVSISHIRQTMRADTGFRTGYVDMWTIRFRLRADTQAALTTEISDLYSAFGVDGFDLVLLDNSSNNSAFITDSDATTSGVRIKNIEFPDIAGGQYTTFIDGIITAEAETVTSISTNLVSTDSFTVIGDGGPKIVILETSQGSPIAQVTRQRTKVVARQSGMAQAAGAVPNKPIIMFPDLLIHEQKRETERFNVQGGKIVWTIEWDYPYQATQYFAGRPPVRL